MSHTTDLPIADSLAPSFETKYEVITPPGPAARAQTDDLSAERELRSPRAYRITDVCKLTGLGRTTIYAASKSGDLITRKYGRCTIVLEQDLDRFLRNLPSATCARRR